MIRAPTRRQLLATGGVSVMIPDTGAVFPSRPIRFICPFVAGGLIDTLIRAVTPELAADLGQPVVIDVRPGANGALAAQQLHAAPPDGHTWMMATLGTTIAHMIRARDARIAEEMCALALIAHDISVLAIPAALPARTLPEFLDLARSTPGRFNYLRTGPGSLSHLVVELLRRASGIEIEAVDYSGLPPGIVDLLAGRIQFAALVLSLALPHIRAGQLRALAVIGPRRAPGLPDVPTLAELGIADANVAAWAMATVRAGTPAARISRIGGLFERVLAEPVVRDRLSAAGVVPADVFGQAEADALLQREVQRYGTLLGTLGIRGD